MKARLVINTRDCLTRFTPKFHAAQKFLDSEVLRDSAPFTPMRTGNLMTSGSRGTVIGSGKVIYNAPYAKKCYYGRHFKFSKAKHPQARAQWFEGAKATKFRAWKQGVEAKLKG